MSRRAALAVSLVLPVFGLSACLWGMATVGGTLSGLPSGTTVTLQNNGTNDLTLSQNGRFQFTNTLDENKAYSVTVSVQPSGATCTVANGSGTIDAAGNDVDNVSVTCTTNASITGTVSGLASGVSLTLADGSRTVAVTANGAWAIPGLLSNGTAYNVTVSTQPAGQTCTVASGSGTYTIGTPTNVVVTCG
jgi:hypothetical protein